MSITTLSRVAAAAVLASSSVFCATGAFAAKELPIPAEAQLQDQWCWATTGVMITKFYYPSSPVNQNDFCKAGRNLTSSPNRCPNQPAEMVNVQAGFRAYKVQPGRATRTLSFDEVKRNVDNNSPMPVGYYRNAGGGHMVQLAGYNDRNDVFIVDPWPTNQRKVYMPYSQFMSNSEWKWAESITGVSAEGTPAPGPTPGPTPTAAPTSGPGRPTPTSGPGRPTPRPPGSPGWPGNPGWPGRP